MQLLPYADHIIVLNEDGRIAEKGSFDHLNSSEGFVGRLGLKKYSIEEAEKVEEEEMEQELLEKEAVMVKIASKEALEAKNGPDAGQSRGKRSADALFAYIRSMGNVAFPIFCAFTVCNVGFRSAQREFFPIIPLWRTTDLSGFNSNFTIALWLNVWTSSNEQHPNSNMGYYVGIYVLFGALNVVFLAAQFW